MADYVLRGTERLVTYMRTLAVDRNLVDRVAAALGIPRQKFSGKGLPGSAFVSRRYSEKEAQAAAAILGVEPSDVTTNGGQEVVG